MSSLTSLIVGEFSEMNVVNTLGSYNEYIMNLWMGDWVTIYDIVTYSARINYRQLYSTRNKQIHAVR